MNVISSSTSAVVFLNDFLSSRGRASSSTCGLSSFKTVNIIVHRQCISVTTHGLHSSEGRGIPHRFGPGRRQVMQSILLHRVLWKNAAIEKRGTLKKIFFSQVKHPKLKTMLCSRTGSLPRLHRGSLSTK